MPIRWRRVAAAAFGLWLFAAVGSAQPPGNGTAPPAPASLPAGYFQAGLMFTGHGEGEQYHRASPPLTGMPPGVAVGLGVRVNPRVALEAEVVVDGTLSASQADVYFTRTDYTAQSRDILLGATLRFRPGRGSPVEFTAGGGTAFSRFARRDIVETRTFPPGVTRWPDAETSTWEPTLTGSVAIAMRLSPHVEVVPSIGVRWIRRGFDTDAWYFGVGRTMVLVGAAFRVRP